MYGPGGWGQTDRPDHTWTTLQFLGQLQEWSWVKNRRVFKKEIVFLAFLFWVKIKMLLKLKEHLNQLCNWSKEWGEHLWNSPQLFFSERFQPSPSWQSDPGPARLLGSAGNLRDSPAASESALCQQSVQQCHSILLGAKHSADGRSETELQGDGEEGVTMN